MTAPALDPPILLAQTGAVWWASVLLVGVGLGLVIAVAWGLARDRLARADARPDPGAAAGAEAERATQRLDAALDRLSHAIDARSQRLEELLGRADDGIRRLEALSDEPPALPTPAAPHLAGPVDAVSARMYELADEGLPSVEIARTLDQHLGKVELILALRR
jgi:hypothetical protein